MQRIATRVSGTRMGKGLVAFVLVLGLATPVAVVLGSSPAGAQATAYTPSTPTLATITNPSSCTSTSTSTCAPWNEWQGDPGSLTSGVTATGTDASSCAGTAATGYGSGCNLLPAYNPTNGPTTTSDNGPGAPAPTCSTTPPSSTDVTEPNLSVVPGACSGTDGTAAYPSGVAGTPGPLGGYCGSGTQTTEYGGTPAKQPAGTTLPLAPAYFPHVVRNADGSLTGYFDYRPKDADEALVAATSTDNGKDWTFDSEALEQNNGYCPSADVNDDGEGHANVISVGGSSYLYTLPRAAGDMQGVGMIVHQLNPTSGNPLNGLPATESIGIDPDAFATGNVGTTYPVPVSGTAESIPVTSTGTAGSPDQLVTGAFIDWTQFNGNIQPADQIQCTVTLGVNTLSNCLAPYASGTITINPGDLLEQVLGYTSPTSDNAAGPIPTGPNTTNGDGGQASETIEAVPVSGSTGFANPLTGTTFNNNAPNRLYLDNTTIYCAQANANPTTHIENCTTPGAPVTPVAWTTPNQAQIFTGDPIIPATSYDPSAGDGMTDGLVAPDGIVGVLPNYPNVPSGDTAVMYTEKELNYYVAGDATNTIGTVMTSKKAAVGWGSGAQTIQFIESPYIAQSLPAPSAVTATTPVTVSVGLTIDTGAGTTGIAPVTCTGLTEVAAPGNSSLTGCTVPSSATYAGQVYDFQNYTMASNTYLGAPGATTVAPATLALTGEGSASNAAKLYKNNEDLTILRVAYTADGVTFSSSGLTNNGIVSDCVDATSGVPLTTGSCTSPGSTGGSSGINDPSSNTNPPGGLNSYAANEGTPGGSNGTSLGGQSGGDLTEMRWAGSAGSIIVNPNGTYGLFLSGAWAGDGDSDAFNQIFYSEGTTTNGTVTWSVPEPVVSTDYSFSASYNQDNNVNGLGSQPIGISAYYEGRAYGPSVVQNPDGTLTMVFAGYRFPKSINSAGTPLGTGSNTWSVNDGDVTMYRNIMTTTLTSSTSPSVATQTTLAPVTSPVVAGQAQTLSATVSPVAPGTGTPTGTVTFAGGSGTLCTATLNEAASDTASCSYTYPGPLSTPDSVTASYAGDSNYGSSASTAQTIAVSQDVTTTSTPVATDTTSSDPANPAVVGESVTFTSDVASSGPSVSTPTGTVTFSDASGTLCSATLNQQSPNAASCTSTYTHATPEDDVVATYGGDTDNAGSASTALDEVVDAASTSTTVTSSPSSPVTGQQVTFTATVAAVAPGAGTPTGAVTFSDAGGTLCSAVSLSGTAPDTATCQATYSSAGMDTVTAAYAGSADFAASSGSTGVTSGLGGSTVQLQSSENPAARGDAPTFTATVQAVSPATGTPDGTVTFSFAASGSGAAPACTGGDTVTLSQGVATCTLSAGLQTAQSPITVGADYSGSAGFTASDATPVTETVGKGATTTLTIKESQDPLTPGSAVSFKATVAATAPGIGLPQGTITWTITNVKGNPVTCSTTTVSGQAVLKSKCAMAAGILLEKKSPYTVTATFVGTAKFDGSSDTITEIVGGG